MIVHDLLGAERAHEDVAVPHLGERGDVFAARVDV